MAEVIGVRQPHDAACQWRCETIAKDPIKKIADAALPGGVYPCGRPSPRIGGDSRVYKFRQVEDDQAADGSIADLADLLVSACVVVAGADEKAAVLVIERDLVAGTS